LAIKSLRFCRLSNKTKQTSFTVDKKINRMKLFQFHVMFLVLVGLMLAISENMVAAAIGNCVFEDLIFDFLTY